MIEQRDKPRLIVRRAPMNDVQILGRRRRPVQNSSGSANNDELNACIDERLQERLEISLLWVRHGIPPARDVPWSQRAAADAGQAKATIGGVTCRLQRRRQSVRRTLPLVLSGSCLDSGAFPDTNTERARQASCACLGFTTSVCNNALENCVPQ